MILAYDQGLEHGPKDFNEKNYNPEYVLNVGREGGFTGFACQIGVARKYWYEGYPDLPLILKVNGKSNIGRKKYAAMTATPEEAKDLGAVAVGYTIYLGGECEAKMFREFSQLRKRAHELELAVIAWMYPFITLPSSSDDERHAEIVAYATRVGAELGADAIKIKYPHEEDQLSWIIKQAFGTKVLISGGSKSSDEEYLEKLDKFMQAGGDGVAVGRNIWQNEDPLSMAERTKKIVLG